MTDTFDLPAFIATLTEGADYAYMPLPEDPSGALTMCFTAQGMRKFMATADTPRAREVEAWLDRDVLPALRN